MIINIMKRAENECGLRLYIPPLLATFVLYRQYWIVMAYQKTKLALSRLLAIGWKTLTLHSKSIIIFRFSLILSTISPDRLPLFFINLLLSIDLIWSIITSQD